jgi:aminomethyltransferase
MENHTKHAEEPLKTPLHSLHQELGGRMVPFAGYDMPVQFDGILAEHAWTRTKAGLFDVSHMGQATLYGPKVDAFIERLVPGDIQALKSGQMRYTQFTNTHGGILDDLMVTKLDDTHLFLVVNAACKQQDFDLIEAALPSYDLQIHDDRALIALQGPMASDVLSSYDAGIQSMPFMSGQMIEIEGVRCFVTRSGYTGEDGYEISIPNDKAEVIARLLLADERVKPIGLGARDSLRLEAGLCLYGHDIDESTSPIEAGLLWSISKRRREEGGFPGADIIQKHIQDGPPKKRVGLKLQGKMPAREGAQIVHDGKPVGLITSGGFSPTLKEPIAMGYVEADFSKIGTELAVVVRGKDLTAKVEKMPFVPQRYYRG